MMEIGEADLVRSARDDLLAWEEAVLDQATDTVARDAQHRRGLRHREPLAALLGGAVRVDAVHASQGADTVRGPGLPLTGGHAHSVQRRGDVFVRPSGRHAPHHGERLLGGPAAMLTGVRFADPQLRVLAASPVDRQDDFARRLVDVGNDVRDKGSEEPLTGAHGQRLARSMRHRDRRPVRQSRVARWPDRAVRTVSNRAWHVSTRRSAASQLFSSWAAIKRLSGSQAA